jgi:hypothetical protein
MSRRSAVSLVIVALVAGSPAPARAVSVEVVARGEVEFNLISVPPLDGVAVGDPVTMSFLVDSTVFEDHPTVPTRGYPVDRPTFLLQFPSVDVGLQDPFPAGMEAYFVVRNDDPAVDGFVLSPALSGGLGPPLDVAGSFGPFTCYFQVTYDGTRLPSLDILDALGFYDFTGLTVYGWSLDDGPFNALGIIFQDLTISALGLVPEACCFPDGTCDDLDAADCAATGGAAQGAGTDCAATACPAPAEACCFPDGTCDDVDPADCAATGGAAQGPGTDCASAGCLPSPEACCFVDGSCSDLVPADCAAAGGAAQGAGTGCAATTCPVAPQACCFPDGTCDDLEPADCAAAGGAPAGPATSCAVILCPPPAEACCFSDGTCGDLAPASCRAMGGTPQGPGSDCAATTCAQPTQACCFGDSTCDDLEPGDCAGLGGEPAGPGSDCASTTCPRPPGRVPADIRVSKVGADLLLLRWSPTDCEPGSDHGVHEGAIGDWYRHLAIDCSDELADLEEIVPSAPGGRYYLVVPHGALVEGSHGRDSTGSERPVGPLACRPVQVLGCPP